ncbi:RNA pyrophosphohydrolase [Alcanivorax sediminis]
MTGIIDEKGFRLNVGIIIAGEDGRVFWGRRVGNRDAWQFPQGGMMPGETPEETLFRELEEEVGLREEHVEIIASTEGWLTYRLPRRFLRRPRNRPHCIGQRQKWFLLRLTASEESIDLFASDTPEFKAWRWVNYWYPIRKVVHFKRGVYARALRELAPALKKEVGTLSGKAAATARTGGSGDA